MADAPKSGASKRSVPKVLESDEDIGRPSAALLDMTMLELLVCPQTKGPLTFDETAQELISEKARLVYPVRDGVPILLVAEARVLED